MDGPKGWKWTVRPKVYDLEPNWAVIWAKVDGLMSQSGRSRVKVDSHSTKSGRSFGWIKLSKWTSSFVTLNRPVSSLWTFQFHSFRPTSFGPLYCLLLSLETVQIHLFRSYSLFSLDHPLLDFRTVHFRRPSTFSLLDCPVSVVWTVQFIPVGPSTLILGRPLYTWPPNQIFSLKTLTQLICKKIKCYNWSFEKGTEDSGPSSPS